MKRNSYLKLLEAINGIQKGGLGVFVCISSECSDSGHEPNYIFGTTEQLRRGEEVSDSDALRLFSNYQDFRRMLEAHRKANSLGTTTKRKPKE